MEAASARGISNTRLTTAAQAQPRLTHPPGVLITGQLQPSANRTDIDKLANWRHILLLLADAYE